MNPIYLDNNSTTKIDQRVADKIMPFLTDYYGNPSSSEHAFGWEANDSVNQSRHQISKLINCSPNEIIFTSGATESNNISILGILKKYKKGQKHAITVMTEHKSVLDVFEYASKNGTSVTYLNVNKNGIINLNELEDSINDETKLISIMLANNEIGVIQPIDDIYQICKKKDIILHVDAAQALGKISIDLDKTKIDIMSLSSHKIYGPKGVGCVYINRNRMRDRILPIIFGGGHERGLRPGTLALHNIVGFGEACRIAENDMDKDIIEIHILQNLLLEGLKKKYPQLIINGDINNRIPGNLNISFPNLGGESLVKSLTKIAVSSGSACTSASPEPSHVLKSIGLNQSLINSTIRVGIGRFNTKEEIDIALEHILEVVNRIKK
tara:strand:+ start:1507 stop:2652 length:1146 start_codon:yes stop_codon:yes gene_type:complete